MPLGSGEIPGCRTRLSRHPKSAYQPELAKSIGIGIGFLSCIGIGIVKANLKVLVLVLLRGFSKYWY